MHSLNIENSEKWKGLASIDYFTQFIKAWIPFNAWYKNYYPDLTSDRAAINAIKTQSKFRNKILSLLNDQGNDGVAFRSRVAELHKELEKKHVLNKNERITFQDISVESNSQKHHSFTYSSCKYEVQRGIPHRKGEIDISIYGKTGKQTFKYTQTSGFDVSDLISNSAFTKLSLTQQGCLKECYQQINPTIRISLLVQDPEVLRKAKEPKDKKTSRERFKQKEWIEVENFLFINDPDKICKGVIEILYNLRNVLFHGEIVPDSDTNRVYEPAYYILYTLIQAL